MACYSNPNLKHTVVITLIRRTQITMDVLITSTILLTKLNCVRESNAFIDHIET